MKLSCAIVGWLVLGSGCTSQSEIRDDSLVVHVPVGMEIKARSVADTLFLFHGALVDSVVYEPGGRLRVALHEGVYQEPPSFENGTCGGGTVPLPALHRLGAVAYRVFAAPDSVAVVEIAHSGRELEVASVFGGTRSCGGVTGTSYYRPGEASW